MLRRLITIALITAAIGAPAAFFTIALPAFMRDGGASLAEIGLVYIVWAPSALKWLWAPWFDGLPRRPFGDTFGWMRALTLAIALTFLPAPLLVGQAPFWLIVGLAVVSAGLSVTLQLLLAGWLMEDFDEPSRALANGVGVAGMVAGGVVGGGLLPLLAERFGLSLTTACIAIAIAATGLGTLGIGRSTATRRPPVESVRAFLSAWGQLFHTPGSRAMLAMLALLSLSAGADVTIPARLIDSGFDPVRTSLLLGMVATLAVIPASALAGICMRIWGKAAVLMALALAKAGILGLLAAAAAFDPGVVAALSVLDFVIAGAATAAIWQVYMAHAGRARAPLAAYGVLTALDAAVRLVAGIAAGSIGAMLGYPVLFTLAALLSAFAALAVLLAARLPGQPAGAN